MIKVRIFPDSECFILSSLLNFSQHYISRNIGKLHSLVLSDFFDVFRLFPFKIACWCFVDIFMQKKKMFSVQLFRCQVQTRMRNKRWVEISFMLWVHGKGIFVMTEWNLDHVQKYPCLTLQEKKSMLSRLRWLLWVWKGTLTTCTHPLPFKVLSNDKSLTCGQSPI